jgi:hypothetical protein
MNVSRVLPLDMIWICYIFKAMWTRLLGNALTI